MSLASEAQSFMIILKEEKRGMRDLTDDQPSHIQQGLRCEPLNPCT